MNRDALFATIIGFFIGIIITSGVLYGKKALSVLPALRMPELSILKPKPPSTKPTVLAGSSPEKTVRKFAITSVKSDEIVTDKKLTVRGTAQPDSTVVIAGPNDEAIALAGADGDFESSITLSEGKNTVTAIQIGKDMTTEQTDVRVFYTEEPIK